VCRTLDISSAAEIVTAVYSHEIPRAVIASLAPLAFDAAERLDAVSCDLVTNAATDLAAMVIAVARRLNLQEQLSLSVTGAVLLQHERLRSMVVDAITAKGTRVASTTIVADAVQGAVRMAQTLAHQGQSNPRSSDGDE
jgi:N-acetylglucosamine kinase-like BadF-type ATPase